MLTPDNLVIQGLWVGDRLSPMEQMCVSSYLHHGHQFHLYAYGKLAGVPPGTTVRDAREILPQSAIWTYRDQNSYAGFADFFRFKLLASRGGWWVDMDMVAIRPLDFASEYVFSSAVSWEDGQYRANVGALKAPPRSPVMSYAWAECQQRNPKAIKWGEVGPALMCRAIKAFDLQRYVVAPRIFCPMNNWKAALDPTIEWDFPEETRAIHFWNELWRRAKQDKSAGYPHNCLYEQLKRRYEHAGQPGKLLHTRGVHPPAGQCSV